ncbi:condensation domain-containing protein [Dictyobacter vulcani]|nr:condensation domain-containing protein [Dictyobacter vulcani]
MKRDEIAFSDDQEELLQLLLEQEELLFPEESTIVPRKESENVALSFAQQRLWFLDQLEPGNASYNIASALKLVGVLHVEALKQSIQEIANRHELLRTHFHVFNGEVTHSIEPAWQAPVNEQDLQHLAAAEKEAEALRLVTLEAQQPFNLLTGPLLRVTLLKLSSEEHILVLVLHHIIADGWSLGVFTHELTQLYAAFVENKPAPLPELPVQYLDYVLWQREQLQGEHLDSLLAYWHEQLKGSPGSIDLPTDHPRPPVQTFNGDAEKFAFSAELTHRIKQFCQQEDATLFMVLLAAFQALLFRYSAQDDIAVGTPIANRELPEIEGLIGLFINTLVMRTDLAGDPSFSLLVKRVREVALNAYAAQDLPFEQIVDNLQAERDPSRTPIFQVMFVLQNMPMPRMDLANLTLYPLQLENKSAKFDLTLVMIESEQGLSGVLEYNTDLYEQATIQRMLTHFQLLLENMLARPHEPIAALAMTTRAEQDLLLTQWNATWTPYPGKLLFMSFLRNR